LKVLILDNYDSFVYNLAQYVGKIADEVIVKRNNEVNIPTVLKLSPDRIIISPGPGTPADPRYFGVCTEVLRKVSSETPTLGVCLGHQGIVHSFGGKIVKAKRIESPFEATRYHSLIADRRTLPDSLEVSAQSEDDREIMGVRHRVFPIEGVQFHPESILTVHGHRIIENFLDA
jgi:anthranilate synthase component 2